MKQRFQDIFKKIKSFFYRPPDSIIGSELEVPYLLRWHIIPRNKYFNIYLHKFLRDDEDRARHCHPWASLSLLLSGSYIEDTVRGRKLYKTWRLIYREATYTHRIELIDNKPAWTLFITGPKVRDWGFHCPKGWIPWWEFTAGDVNKSRGQIGRGCGD